LEHDEAGSFVVWHVTVGGEEVNNGVAWKHDYLEIPYSEKWADDLSSKATKTSLRSCCDRYGLEIALYVQENGDIEVDSNRHEVPSPEEFPLKLASKELLYKDKPYLRSALQVLGLTSEEPAAHRTQSEAQEREAQARSDVEAFVQALTRAPAKAQEREEQALSAGAGFGEALAPDQAEVQEQKNICGSTS
jgi:hypothetical protein